MSEINEERKNELRQTENYKKTKEIIDRMLTNVLYAQPKRKGLLPSPYTLFQKNCVEFYEKWMEAEEVSEVLKGLKSDVDYNNDKLKSMSQLLAYLGLIESLGVALADMVLILLIANGQEVHTRHHPLKHVKFLQELRKLELGHKLELLKDGGIVLFKEFINKDVRDHIAHLNFIIENNGKVRKKDNSPIHIEKLIDQFWDGIDTMKLIFEDLHFFKRLEKMYEIAKIEKEKPLLP